jgi:proteasome lid subunit RPN8/RPN11
LSKTKKEIVVPVVAIATGVVRSIRQHARSSIKTEVCGILIGDDDKGRVNITACIQGLNAAQGGAHVTFTQETWEHIYKVKDREYPNERIVGWYHSHPAFGIFLSDHDLFIQQNFFSSPLQVAWVYDPVSDEEGCFGWVNGEIERLTQVIFDDREEGRRSSNSQSDGNDEYPDWGSDSNGDAPRRDSSSVPHWVKWTNIVITHLIVLVLGFAVGMYFFRMRTDEAVIVGYVNGARDCARGQLTLNVPLGNGVTLAELLGGACGMPPVPTPNAYGTPQPNSNEKKR